MSDDQRTPLHPFHTRHQARLVPFAGWEMPIQYTSILEEHQAVRTSAGLFDVSHMGEAQITGPDAAAFLDYVATHSIAPLKLGQARYTLLCTPEGGCVDDVIIYRRSEEDFFICLNAANTTKDIAWLQQHSNSFSCTVTDVSAQYAQLALQGPQAETILASLTTTPLAEIAYFHFTNAHIGNAPTIIARTGYTGEPGFELYISPEYAEAVAGAIVEAGKPHGLKLIGLGARDSLRLEMGYPLYGHEISESISPLQAGLGWAVKFKKSADFLGKAALEAEKRDGLSQQIIYFTLSDRRIARPDTDIVHQDTIIGKVVSGTHSPTLNQPIGSALIDTRHGLPDSLAVRIRKQNYPITLTKPPFVKTSL